MINTIQAPNSHMISSGSNTQEMEVTRFGAVCSGCNTPYLTNKWAMPWQCPECARGGRRWLAGLAWGLST